MEDRNGMASNTRDLHDLNFARKQRQRQQQPQ